MATQEWGPIIGALTAGESLDYGQSYWLMDQVMSGGTRPRQSRVLPDRDGYQGRHGR